MLMARFVEPFQRKQSSPQTPEQFQIGDHARSGFGLDPTSIRAQARLYFVGVRDGLCDSLEFICASGMLIGIPPKRRE